MRFLVHAATIAVVAFGLVVVMVKQRPIASETAYVGSDACSGCHRRITASWQDSLHTKMMRPVHAPGVLVADLETDPASLPFDPEDAVWAIGGKWAQQFMGRAGGQETLLPGAWEVAHGRWQRVGWDGWQVPVPLRRCHGCHTVGLDLDTGAFVEPNIGCESCHGPGAWHVRSLGIGRIHRSPDSQLCGQCHTRGRSPDGELHFPAGYRPGGKLSETFVPSEPSWGQNSSSWWGNGRERRRHQQYASWSRGGHAASLDSIRGDYDGRYGPASDDCLSCHAAEAILEPEASTRLEEARYGITCQVCHNVHGELDQLRVDCAGCHRAGAFQHRVDQNAGHVPCPPEAEVDCVSCHMPAVIENGGVLSMRSHAPGVVHPRDTGAFGVPNSCANGGCHASEGWEAMARRFDAFYGEPETSASGLAGSRTGYPER